MLKFLKSYYYALIPVGLPLITFIGAYLLGYRGELLMERIQLFLVGGLIVASFGVFVEFLRNQYGFSRFAAIGITSANFLFWGVLILIVYVLKWENFPFNTDDGTYYPSMWMGYFFNALVFYVNALFLFPKFQVNKLSTTAYLGVAFCLILGTAIAEGVIDLQLAKHLGLLPELEYYYREDNLPVESVIIDWTIQYSFIHTFYLIISFVLVFVLQYAQYQKDMELLEKEKLNSELKFLKAQINPHFLFNGINSVYHLIDQKPTIAKDTLLKFSNLLRYQLYECNDDLIPLEKELAHIQDYVEMEKIRKGEDAVITLTLPDETNGIKIPPLLFTPFIENAFKYVSNHDDGTKNKIAIQFRLQIEAGKLRFEAENTIDDYLPESNGGIGIANVKKRLALLFPKQHDLDILPEKDRFMVRMSLDLKKPANKSKKLKNE